MTEGDRASRVVRAYLAARADAEIDELVAVLAPAVQQVLMPS